MAWPGWAEAATGGEGGTFRGVLTPGVFMGGVKQGAHPWELSEEGPLPQKKGGGKILKLASSLHGGLFWEGEGPTFPGGLTPGLSMGGTKHEAHPLGITRRRSPPKLKGGGQFSDSPVRYKVGFLGGGDHYIYIQV